MKTSKVGGDNATTIAYTYDANRNPATVADPSLGQLTYEYNGFGEMTYSATPRDTATYTYDALGRMVTRTGLDGYSHWQYDVAFKGTLSYTYYEPVSGPTVSERYTYDRLGKLIQQGQQVGFEDNGQDMFGQACFWTATGNLASRADMKLNFVESFTYDRFNRLTSASVGPLSKPSYNNDSYNYDTKGNVVQKDGVGVYAYEHETNPYAVTGMSPNPLVIDRLADQTVDYTPFDKVSSVTENGVTKKLHYLTSATGLFAIFVSTSSGGGTMYYTLKDHQGSLAAVVHGNTVERLSYDPWGRRRNTTNFGYDNVSHTFDRGYTLHEHYDGFDLINMNGRLYDPILGRMLSPDIVVQDEQSSQAYNRYSYCFNNPLRFTDPSGYVVRGARDYYDWSSMTYYDFGRFKNKGSAFNTDLSEGKFSPVYDVNGVLLGTTKEGFSGQVLIYAGSEDIDFSSLSESDALLIEGVSTYDLLSEKLPGETKSNIWTNIVSQMEGARVYDVVFHMSDLRENKIIFNPNINAGWSSSYALKTGEGKIQGSDKYHYETTVENIQSTIVVHEYYSHIQKNNGDNYRSHRLAYKNVINYKPLWNKTTDAYKGFVVRRLLEYTKRETGRTKVDPPYRYSYNKYRDYY